MVTAAEITPSKQINQTFTPVELQTTLYSQLANPSGGGAAAQDFEAAYDAYDCFVADDFNVTWVDGWTVEQLHTPGSYSLAGPADGITYEFLTNSGGFPGAPVAGCSGIASIVSDNAGDIVSALAAPCDLTSPTTYWVSVAARMDYATSGQWYVSTEAVTTNSIARWYNPGDGFLHGCTSWTSCDISVINATYLDMSFEILGATIPVELQSFDAE
jgi:hypothetical protein